MGEDKVGRRQVGKMSLVHCRKDGPVAVMRMDNGENRFNPPLVSEIHRALDEFEADAAVRAVVITGTDKYFSNGLDLSALAQLQRDALSAFVLEFARMYKRVGIYPKPTVAAINGHAFAGGAMLAALADFRYMRADRGWLCLPEVDIKLPFWPGMIALLEEAFPRAQFRHAAYSGKRFTAQELATMGFLDGIYPNEELLPRCIEQAAFLATKNPAAYAEIKRRIKAEMARIMDEEDPKYYF